MRTLYDKLACYAESDYYGFHMPGHKRNRNVTAAGLPYELDITEIDGFDDLHHAKGILRQAQERAARVYRAEETHFLVNGSTAGILSAVLGCTQRGDKILTARNCHKSVYHAIYMNELEAVYLYPRFDAERELNGPVAVEDVREALQRDPEIRAVIITSPTYDGMVSDVERIAEAAHEYGIPLIVDGAHGAHFGFHPYFPEHANVQGADVVINSVHKTLPALTQTALLHINGKYADREEIRKYLHMIQSSSPSYVLMASIDECIRLLDEKQGKLFDTYVEMLKEMRTRLEGLKCLRLLDTDDASKVVISVKGTDFTSQELSRKLLEQYHLQVEMTAGSYVLAMTSVGDTREGMERLVQALAEIDADLAARREENAELQRKNRSFELLRLEQVYTSAETARKVRTAKSRAGGTAEEKGDRHDMPEDFSVRRIPWEQSAGYISTESAYLYPPGIPLIVPGERISSEAARLLCEYRNMGFEMEGLKHDGEIEILG